MKEAGVGGGPALQVPAGCAGRRCPLVARRGGGAHTALTSSMEYCTIPADPVSLSVASTENTGEPIGRVCNKGLVTYECQSISSMPEYVTPPPWASVFPAVPPSTRQQRDPQTSRTRLQRPSATNTGVPHTSQSTTHFALWTPTAHLSDLAAPPSPPSIHTGFLASPSQSLCTCCSPAWNILFWSILKPASLCHVGLCSDVTYSEKHVPRHLL